MNKSVNETTYTKELNEKLLKSFHSKVSSFPKKLLEELLDILQKIDIQPISYMYNDNLHWEYKNDKKELKFIFSNELAKDDTARVVINDEELFTIKITVENVNHILKEYIE